MGLRKSSEAARRASGFTLIEVVVVMLIFGVVVTMVAVMTRGISAAQKRSLTAARIATVEAALVQFVQQQRRLPCPADGRVASSVNSAGTEDTAGVNCNMIHGVVPWRVLGLSENDATDGWDRRITYRPFPALTLTAGMDMSWCDPAGTEPPVPPTAPRACANTCSSTNPATCTPPAAFIYSKGMRVLNLASPQATVMDPVFPAVTGAAYVLISHGESGGGGYLNSGVLGVSSVDDGDEEKKNYANLGYTPPAPANSATGTYYVDHGISDVAGANHFDDIVSRPSILSVITKAGLGPRAH